MEITEDGILNGKIKLFQPAKGYRAAIDPIILAGFVHLEPRLRILDVGCGVGTISLILKSLENTAGITAVDMDAEMCELCLRNSVANHLDLEIIHGKIEDLESDSPLKGRFFDRVVTNPPFFKSQSSRISDSKRLANFETIGLADWIASCLKRLKNKGILSMIHRADRAGDVVSAMNDVGSVEIIPIFSKRGREADRVVINCCKNYGSGTKISPGLVVHNDDGSYSEEVGKILAGNFGKSTG
ncbi:MAG: methyltransferase [Holosporaceae bacterium]|nr:methyltransferase [Holosporaceae bacterium]